MTEAQGVELLAAMATLIERAEVVAFFVGMVSALSFGSLAALLFGLLRR